MRKTVFWGIVLALAAGPQWAAAETVVLKSGQKVTGKVVERTDAYVRLDLDGLSLTYFADEVDRIEGGEKPATPAPAKPAVDTSQPAAAAAARPVAAAEARSATAASAQPAAAAAQPVAAAAAARSATAASARPTAAEQPLTAVIACASSPDYINEWIGAPFDQAVGLERLEEVQQGKTMYVSVVVGGFAASDKGAIDLIGDFEVLDPEGNVVFSDKDVFRHEVPSGAAAKGFVMLDPAVDVMLDEGDPGGRYTLRAVVRDRVGQKSAIATHTVLLKEAPAAPQAPAPVTGDFKTVEEFVRWMTYYYVKPDPTRVMPALKFYVGSEIFGKESARRPAATFFAELIRPDASRVQALRDEASAAAPGDPRTFFSDVLKLVENKPDLLKDPIEEAGQLDMLWAAFMATGSEAYVRRIVEVLPWEKEGKGFKKLIGAAAAWSLKSNVQQHARVAEICRQALSTTEGAVHDALAALLGGSSRT